MKNLHPQKEKKNVTKKYTKIWRKKRQCEDRICKGWSLEISVVKLWPAKADTRDIIKRVNDYISVLVLRPQIANL